MIDLKSKLVLNILAKSGSDGSYKIVEIADIIMALPSRYRMDSDAVKHILTHLERQDLISVKYDEDGVYCLAVLPFGFETLENEKVKIPRSSNPKKFITSPLLCFFASFLGALLGSILCFLFF